MHRRAGRGGALPAGLVHPRPGRAARRRRPTSPTSRRWGRCPPRCSSASPARRTRPWRRLTGLADGLWAEAGAVGVGVVGGDVASSATLVLSVTALGSLEGRAPGHAGRGPPGRRRGAVRADRLVGRGPRRAGARLPVAGGGGRGAPRAGAALRRRTAGGAGRRHLDDRHLRRAARRPRARRAGVRGAGGRAQPPRSRCRRGSPTSGRRWASTRCTGCSPAGRTTRSPPRSRPVPPARGLDGDRRGRARAIPGCWWTAGPTTGGPGWTHFTTDGRAR